MIDYGIGDKVVCIIQQDVNIPDMLKYGSTGFELPTVGQVYTVVDMAPGHLFHCDDNEPGVRLAELEAGLATREHPGRRWWYGADGFRKALPSDLAADTTRQHQPA